MQIQHIRTELKTFDHLTLDERRLLLWSMVVMNDLNLLRASAALSASDSEDRMPVGRARTSQMLFFLTLLAGKLSEAWDAFQRDFANASCFRDRLPYLPGSAQESYNRLTEYFRVRRNPVCMVRNWVSFHYGTQLRDSLDQLPPGTPVGIWLAPSSACSRFDIGSVAVTASMNNEFSEPNGTLGYHRFLRDVLRVHDWFDDLLSAFVMYLLDPSSRGKTDGATIEVPPDEPHAFPPFLDPSQLKAPA